MSNSEDYYTVQAVDLKGNWQRVYVKEGGLYLVVILKQIANEIAKVCIANPINVKVYPPSSAIVITPQMKINMRVCKESLEELVNGKKTP